MPFEEDSVDFLSGAEGFVRGCRVPGPALPRVGLRPKSPVRSWIACRSTAARQASASRCSCFSLTV